MTIRPTPIPAGQRTPQAVPLPLPGPLDDRDLVLAALLALGCLAVSFASLLAVALLAADIA